MARARGIHLHVYPSTFEFESRMDRIGTALGRAGLFSKVVFVGVWREGLKETETRPIGVQVHRVRSRFADRQGLIQRLARFISWSWRIYRHYRRGEIACINCHSLSAFPLCILLQTSTGASLVYDAHELETETHSMQGLRRWLARMVERLCIHRAKAHVFVNDSIAKWYEQRYGLQGVHVVRNVPPKPESLDESGDGLRQVVGLDVDRMVCLHQGLLQPGRGIEVMLEAFKGLGTSHHLVFLGFGDLVDEIKDHARRFQNIHYHEPVAPERLRSMTRGADIGLHLIPDTCLNHHYCLPNKIFEYSHAGVPFIASDLPEIKAFTQEYQCGWTVAPTAEALCDRLISLDKAAINFARAGCQRAAAEFNWESETDRLLEVYSSMGFAE